MKQKNIIYSRFLYLAFAAVLSLLLTPQYASSSSIESVVAGHNTCQQCHGRFSGGSKFRATEGEEGKPARIPESKIDILCMGCHGPTGISNLKADVHGMQTFVNKPLGCISCHDPHDNNPNYLGGQNIKLIGEDILDQKSHFATIRTTHNGRQYVVFESRGLDAGETPLYSFADGDEDNDGVYDGICEVCHTKTAYHRNNPSGDHSHYTGQTCTECHVHVNQFLPVIGGPGGLEEVSGTVTDISGFAWPNITLFIDLNGNGVYDEGEPTAVTDENGRFTFKGVTDLEGYDVLVMPGSIPDGYEVTISVEGNVVTITTTGKPGSVEGYVWGDTNQSGTYDDSDTGILDVTVFADANGNEVHDEGESIAVTNDLGFFMLSEVPVGSILVQVDETTLSEEFQLITNNNPFTAELEPEQALTDVNFGYRSRLAFNPNNTRLKYPTRLAWAPNGGYYVTDSMVDAIFIHDSEGNLTGQLRGLNKPLGVISDEKGRIYVGNNGRNNVEIYSGGGKLLQVIDRGNLKQPNDLAFDKDQNLYVLDSQNKMVKVYNPDGQFIGRIGQAGGGDGQFTFPIAMAINYRTVDDEEVGEIFVADKKSSRIQVFDLEGNYLRSFGGPVEEGSGGGMMGMFGGMFGGGSTWEWEGKFVGIQSLAFDQNGKLHALDSYQDKVQILNPVTGAYISHYDAFLEDTGAHLQSDIDISSDGSVIMTDVATRSVDMIYTVP